MNDTPEEAYMDVAAALLGLTLAPEWRAGVRMHLANTLRLARLVDALPIPDEADPAPVYTP